MSKDKHKARSRQDDLLLRAYREEGLTVHHLGGMSRKTPELQALIRKGLAVIPLNRGTPPKWSREFDRFFPLNGLGIHGHAPRLRATLTPRGIQRAKALAVGQSHSKKGTSWMIRKKQTAP